jgi:hypothetical protein
MTNEYKSSIGTTHFVATDFNPLNNGNFIKRNLFR